MSFLADHVYTWMIEKISKFRTGIVEKIIIEQVSEYQWCQQAVDGWIQGRVCSSLGAAPLPNWKQYHAGYQMMQIWILFHSLYTIEDIDMKNIAVRKVRVI